MTTQVITMITLICILIGLLLLMWWAIELSHSRRSQIDPTTITVDDPIGKVNDDKELDQTGPWTFLISALFFIPILAATICILIFGSMSFALFIGAVVAIFAGLKLEKLTGTIDPDEVWGMKDGFWPEDYGTGGNKKYYLLKGGLKAWFPWMKKGPVTKLLPIEVKGVVLGVELAGKGMTLKCPFTWKMIIVSVQKIMQVNPVFSDAVEFAKTQIITKFESRFGQSIRNIKTTDKGVTFTYDTTADDIDSDIFLSSNAAILDFIFEEPIPEVAEYGLEIKSLKMSDPARPESYDKAQNAIQEAKAKRLVSEENMKTQLSMTSQLAGLKEGVLPEDKEEREKYTKLALIFLEKTGMKMDDKTITIIKKGGELDPLSQRAAVESLGEGDAK